MIVDTQSALRYRAHRRIVSAAARREHKAPPTQSNKMNDQPPLSATVDEARAALSEIDSVMASTRIAIAQGPSAPILILWGCIWLVADVTTQYCPEAMAWMWWILDLIGAGGTWLFIARNLNRVKREGSWRYGARYGAFWGAVFFYSILWLNLLVPAHWPTTSQEWIDFWPTFRRISAYSHTVPMFAYVIGGLFVGRFFIALGMIVTALVLAGFFWAGDYFFLWLAVTCGGALIFSGVFIRKFWK